jgi:DNA-binding NarL/FixJ family response regulator
MTIAHISAGAPISTLRIVIVAQCRLDGDALTALFRTHPNFRVLSTTMSVKVASLVCRHRQPDVLLMDVGRIGNDACDHVQTFVREIGEIPVMLLDDEPNCALLSGVFDYSSVGYFTRSASFSELADGIGRLATGERAFDSTVQILVHQTPDGWRIRHDKGIASPLAELTRREMEVLRLIALGNTVKNCAEILELARSTVDNHKSRLMKMLGVHKSLDLTRLAIREGLIRV